MDITDFTTPLPLRLPLEGGRSLFQTPNLTPIPSSGGGGAMATHDSGLSFDIKEVGADGDPV